MKTYTVQCWLWCVLLHSELYGHLVTCRSVVVKDNGGRKGVLAGLVADGGNKFY